VRTVGSAGQNRSGYESPRTSDETVWSDGEFSCGLESARRVGTEELVRC